MTFLDRPLTWTREHREGTLLILLVITLISAGLSYRSAHDAADTAHRLAAAAKNQSSKDAQRIDKLFSDRDSRRHQLDVDIYQANLAECGRQNTARAATNAIIEILKDAFAPVAAAERAGKKQTPLVHRLVIATRKLQPIPLTDCAAVIPNPEAPGHK